MKRLLSLAVAACALSLSAAALPEVNIGKFVMTADTLQHCLVGPGTYYTAIQFNSTASSPYSGQIRVFYFTADATNPAVDFAVELGRDSLYGCENISNHVRRLDKPGRRYFGAVNADFFVTQGEVGRPVYGAVANGMVATYPVPGVHHFVISDNRVPWCSPLTNLCQVTPDGGSTVACADYNNYSSSAVTLYNSCQGKYTHCPAEISQVPFELLEGETWKMNAPFRARISGPVSTGDTRIPNGGGVIAAGGSAADVLANFPEGKEITVKITQQLTQFDNVAPSITGEVGSSVLLVQNGQKIPSTNADVHPRTVMGCTSDQKTIILMCVDGRSNISYGGSYDELSDLMIYAGADWATNADGGGSTGIYIPKMGIMNHPSDGSERAVGDGLYLVLNAPDDNEVAHIEFADFKADLPQYGLYTPRFYGYNQYGLLINENLEGVTLSCDPSIGEIIDEGKTLFANGSGYKALTASYNGLTATLPVNVAVSDQMQVKYDHVLLDNYRIWNAEMRSLVNGEYMSISPIAFAWASSDPSTATVNDNGEVKGVKNGDAVVTASLGDFEGKINLTIEVPTDRRMPILANTDVTGLKISKSGIKTIALSPAGNDGFAADFVLSSTRSPLLTITTDKTLWSLPDQIEMQIDKGNTTITALTMTLKAANASGVYKHTLKDFGDDESVTITVPVSDVADPDDIGIYPITLTSLAFTLGGKTSTDYHFDVPSLNGIYLNAPDGVETIAADGSTAREVAVAYYNLQGQRIGNPSAGQVVIRVATLSDGSVRASKIIRN